MTCGEQTAMPKGWASGAYSGLGTAILTYTEIVLTKGLTLWASAEALLYAT